MSRGGRGGARGRGGKRGPDMSWDDEESAEITPNARKPGPLFPERYLPAPKPLTASEKSSVAAFISIRDRMNRGPLYAVLDPTIKQSIKSRITTSQQDVPPSRTNPRAGFDPFNHQEKYTSKYHRQKRTFPDLSERGGYTLRLFPLELWPVLDPKRKMKDWETLTDEQKARLSQGSTTAAPAARSRKRKRDQDLKLFDDDQVPDPDSASEASNATTDDDDENEDIISPTHRRRRQRGTKPGPTNRSTNTTRQKKGLDAEDDYPDIDQQDEDQDNPARRGDGGEGGGGGGVAGEEEPHDSDFGTDEDEDEGDDDYNAEQYFDDGADEMDGFGGGDDGDEDNDRFF